MKRPFHNIGDRPGGGFCALAVLVMALAAFQLAQRTLMLTAALVAAPLLAVWFFQRPPQTPPSRH
jgi:hypothetical protein